MVDASSLEVHYHGRYDDIAARYGALWYFVHRIDLHNELKRLAQNAGATIRLRREIKHVDCEKGVLTTASGRNYKKDLIIAADGLHVSNSSSHFRTCSDKAKSPPLHL